MGEGNSKMVDDTSQDKESEQHPSDASFKRNNGLKHTLLNWGRIWGRFIKGVLETLVGAAAIAAVLGIPAHLYLKERDLRLDQYKTDTDKQIEYMTGLFEQMNGSLLSIAKDNGDVRERIAKMEALMEFQTRVIAGGPPPKRGGEYVPILDSPPMGGEDVMTRQVPGTNSMRMEIPAPRSKAEHDKAIELLLAKHEAYLELQIDDPKFDTKMHTLAVSEEPVLYPDGTLKLELKSYVVLKSGTEDELGDPQ